MNRENNVFYWLPCSVVFVCTAHGETRDIMTATAMFVSEKEPLLAISVAQGHLTEKLINQSENFTLVIAGNEHKQLARQVGSIKGEAGDKLKNLKFQSKKPPVLPFRKIRQLGWSARLRAVTKSRDTGFSSVA